MAADDAAAVPRQRDIIVIGASAGGVQVLLELAAALPPTLPACVLVVLHVGAHRSVLPDLMNARGGMQALHPRDGQPLQRGRILVAPPDHHLLVGEGHVHLQRGPKENHARPAIDPLFRTAALAYGPRVIGVVLSGCLDDGTAGLQAVKRCGGLAVVQDPLDAEQPDMPASALAHVAVDRCVPSAQLAATLRELLGAPHAMPAPPAPDLLVREQAVSDGTGDPMENLNAIGARSRFSCPECAGVLWEIDGARPRRYRCHTGHAFTLRTLAATQDSATDEALWSAMRALQEREALLHVLADSDECDGDGARGPALRERAGHTAAHAQQLRGMMVSD
jgi:two-component system, chemotaxis family, protein-glutamate methylesterase/glutaminase